MRASNCKFHTDLIQIFHRAYECIFDSLGDTTRFRQEDLVGTLIYLAIGQKEICISYFLDGLLMSTLITAHNYNNLISDRVGYI